MRSDAAPATTSSDCDDGFVVVGRNKGRRTRKNATPSSSSPSFRLLFLPALLALFLLVATNRDRSGAFKNRRRAQFFCDAFAPVGGGLGGTVAARRRTAAAPATPTTAETTTNVVVMHSAAERRFGSRRRPRLHPSRRTVALAPGATRRRTGGTALSAGGGGASVVAAAAASSSSSTGAIGTACMALLALQFACQPILTRRYAPRGTVIRSTYVLLQDAVRFGLCFALLLLTGDWGAASTGWNFGQSLRVAGFPALLYVVQNYCSLAAYQLLAPIAYNVLNQTKTISAAIWCYVLMGRKQSRVQAISLVVLVISALVMETSVLRQRQQYARVGNSGDKDGESESRGEDDKGSNGGGTEAPAEAPATSDASSTTVGVAAIVVASSTSGLAGAWTQRALQASSHPRNSLLLSMELAACSAAFLLVGLLVTGSMSKSSAAADGDANNNNSNSGNHDALRISRDGWWSGWTWRTWIPLTANAVGGILVGMVTKYAGSVEKGFALIVGLFVSGILQNVFARRGGGGDGVEKVSAQQWLGGVLAALSLWMHSAFPPAE